jgi:hypothetical protein
MAARLPHQRGAQVVEVLFDPAAPGQDGVAGEFRETVRDDAEGFAAGVRVDRGEAASIGTWARGWAFSVLLPQTSCLSFRPIPAGLPVVLGSCTKFFLTTLIHTPWIC